MEKNRKFSIAYHSVLIAYSILPVVWLLLFWSFVLRSRVCLGDWPSLCDSDLKGRLSDFHSFLTYATMMAIPFSFVPWLIFYMPKKFLFPETKIYKLFLYALPWMITIILFLVDPGDFVKWFID